MALQVNNFTGFETQGEEEASATLGSVLFDTTNQRNGGSCLDTDGASGEYILPWVEGGVTDAGVNHIVGLALHASDKTPSTDADIVRIRDDSGANIFTLRLLTSGNIELWDAADSSFRTLTDPLNESDYVFIEIYFGDINTASGTVQVFIDGNSDGEDTGVDLTSGNSFGSATSDLAVIEASVSLQWFWDDLYILSGAADADDRYGDFAVKMYQNTVEDDTDQEGTLDSGTWAACGETPLDEESDANAASYQGGATTGYTLTDDADSNARAGPENDTDVAGATIKAAKWIWRRKRGNGQGRTHRNTYGSSNGGIAVETGDLTLTTSYSTSFQLSEMPDILIPNDDDHFFIGFWKSAVAGQDTFCAEQWAMLGFVPAVPSVDVTRIPLVGVGI